MNKFIDLKSKRVHELVLLLFLINLFRVQDHKEVHFFFFFKIFAPGHNISWSGPILLYCGHIMVLTRNGSGGG